MTITEKFTYEVNDNPDVSIKDMLDVAIKACIGVDSGFQFNYKYECISNDNN